MSAPRRSAPRTGASPSGGNGRRPTGRLARQHRPGWIAAGVALLALAVLANVYLFQSSSHRSTVVRVARDVPIGRRLTRADLSTASVVLDAGVVTIPGHQLVQVVGRRAAVDLRRGSLLAASQVTTALTPQPGQALVTLAMKTSMLPPGGLAPGSRVRLVPTTSGQDSDAGPGQGTQVVGKDVPATVDAVGGPGTDGDTTVSVLVDDADSNAVARLSGESRVAMVVTTRED